MKNIVQTEDTILQYLLLQKGFKHVKQDLLYVGSFAVNFDKKTFTDMAITCYEKIKNNDIEKLLNKYMDMKQGT